MERAALMRTPTSSFTRRFLENTSPNEDAQAVKNIMVESLNRYPYRPLPLNVQLTSSSTKANHTVYHCVTTSSISHRTYEKDYRYSEFRAFIESVVSECTCHEAGCGGACGPFQDALEMCFPRRRILSSNSKSAIKDRMGKVTQVFRHLLRTILLPGSVMRCETARDLLPPAIFRFLGVDDLLDQRTLLEIYVDTIQCEKNVKPSPSSTETSLMEQGAQCVICLDEMESTYFKSETDRHDANEMLCVSLACRHTFHRKCLFEWLQYESHCPVCKHRVGPPSVAICCFTTRGIQWWLDLFQECPGKIKPESSEKIN